MIESNTETVNNRVVKGEEAQNANFQKLILHFSQQGVYFFPKSLKILKHFHYPGGGGIDCQKSTLYDEKRA